MLGMMTKYTMYTMSVQASGVALTDECLNAYLDLQSKKKYWYIIYKLSADFKEIVVDEVKLRDDGSDSKAQMTIFNIK